jgi:ankyrin repeat protein/serine/threonine protein kinase
MLRQALAGGAEFGEASASENTVEFRSEEAALRFEHYELVTGQDGKPVELGRGAMGVTYKAFDVDLHCLVTLKVISQKYIGDESARLRFLREARAAASLRHPNIASVFHLGKSGENYFYAMEFVEGETVESFIKRTGRMEVKVALEIAGQVAAGLAAVHKQNLVHRDIKPGNIMVSLEEQGARTVKIIDLGLAKAVRESLSEALISTPGVFAGTPAFASPEQLAGVGVDIRSDLYSLGVTLWEMLTGKAPFRGSPAEVMHQHQHAPLPVEQLKGIAQPLVVLLELLLEKDPARRFQSPAELLKVMPMVRDAIDAGRRLMKTIRVFVSSTGDVQKERILADRNIRSIAAEFNLAVSASESNFQRLAEENGKSKSEPENHGTWVVCPHFLEYQNFQLDAAYLTHIPNTAEFDLVICILWSRLGILPNSALKMPGGSPPSSGTEYEIGWALDHAKKNSGLPRLYVYRNGLKPTPPLEPKEERDAFLRQWDSLQEFFASWERNSEGSLADTISNYRNLEEFEELFREHFRSFLASGIGQRTERKALSTKVRRWKSNPFRGLNFFDFEHAPIFHGRTKAIGEVLETLEAQAKAQRPFVLVVGASGSGKSSLVRAGVLSLLTQPGTIEGIGLWQRAITRPGAGGSGCDCFDALAAALLESPALPALEDPESPNAIRDLATELREHSDSVAFRVRDAVDHAAREWKIHQCHYLKERERQLRESGRPDDADLARQQWEGLELPKARLALVIDQLEELFTTGFSAEVQQNYIAALASLIRSGRVFVLATLRSDFYSHYQEFPDLIEFAKTNGKFDLRPPTPYEVGNMIRLPAEAAGLKFEHDRKTGQRLDEALRDAASSTPESLPLLEYVLSLLYDIEEGRSDGLLRWSDYRELGELKGALAKHAEDAFSTLQPEEQKTFPLVMGHLVTLGQGEEEVPNRRTVLYRDLIESAGTGHDQKASAKGFLDLFIEKRLLVADTDPQGEVTVNVAHEALLREWQRVKEWLIESRGFLRMRDRLDLSLKLWLSRGKQKDDLLEPGLHLAEGEKLVQEFGPSLSREQIEYIQASIAERKRRKHAQELIRYAVMGVITVLAIVAGLQWLEADLAKKNRDEYSKSFESAMALLQQQHAASAAADLISAAARGDAAAVQALLAKGTEVNATASNGATALIVASYNGHLEVVQALLAKGADVNAMAGGGTALMGASHNGHLEVAQALLAKGADVNAKTNNGRTALDVATAAGHTEVRALLVQAGAKPVVAGPAEDLISAAERGDTAVVQALLADGTDVDAKRNDGATALIVASYNGHFELVQALLAKGAQVNAKENDGATALIRASQQGHLELVQALLAKGADVNAKANDGGTALIQASQQGYGEVVQTLLAKGAEANAKANDGRTALIQASQQGHREVVQALLAKGADANAKRDDGATALILASQNGHRAVVGALLAKGADVNAKDSAGWTALMGASYNGHLEVVEALLAEGAEVNANTSDGRTALDAAKAGGHAEVGALLLQAGAKP